jgi:predicted DNA-binding transcriptional regulator AlpA
MPQKFIRITELASKPNKPGRWPVSSGTIHRWVNAGALPPPVRLGPGTSAWALEVIERYEAQVLAAPTDNTRRDHLRVAADASVKARALRRREVRP